VVGSLGVSALNAGADEVAGAPAPAAAEASVDPDAPPTFAQTGEEASSPPPVLPWGQKPVAVTKGPVDATSKQLAAIGADIAPKRGPRVLRPEYSPKGYTSNKRTLRSGRTSVPPQPPATTLAEPVLPTTRPVKYHYSSAYQYTEADGSYANMVIGKPKLADEDYHTLAEIAVQSADTKQIVEVGWTVDRGVNGDEEPHLFVYHWVDGKETCYNACGFQQYSKTVFPGDKLAEGTAKRMGIQFFNGAWWIAFDSEWVGYFPGELWDGRFTRSGLIQWFGEVAASSSEPCSAMGTGVTAYDDARAARFGTVSLLNSNDLPVISVDAKSEGREVPVYPASRSSDRTFRYGGPGSKVC
jgi:hypothetical protein